ncbi:MAG: hypothetical protein WA691_05895 [Thermoplasmata archaeon]
MAVPAWVIAYSVLLILGLIVGLLLRFLILTVVIVVSILVVVGVWMLGLVDLSALSNLPTITGWLLDGLPVGPQMLFTIGGIIFIGGALGGVLLTTRLRGLDGPRPA